MELVRIRKTFRIRRRSALRELGLPPNARWDEARPRLKEKIIQARKDKDTEMAVFWSQVKAFLARNLVRSCLHCRTATTGQRMCGSCSIKQLHRERPAPKPSRRLLLSQRQHRVCWRHLPEHLRQQVLSRLGKAPDLDIGLFFGLDLNTVYRLRKANGIPAFGRWGDKR